MKLEPKLALQATLYLALWAGFALLLALLPVWVDIAVALVLAWWMIYSLLKFRGAHQLKRDKPNR
jgi:hypothetical protein